MKKIWQFALILLLISMIPSAKALQAGTPEDALEEMATANDIETVIKHLPVKVEEFIHKLPLAQRTAMMEKLQAKRNVEREGGSITRSSDGRSWEVVERQGQRKATLTWKKTFISGDDALVQVEIKEETHTGLIQIGMHYENGEWRISQAGEWRGTDVEEMFLPKDEPTEMHGADAVATLRTLNTSLVAYESAYPDVGYPTNLPALSGQPNDEPTREHGMFLDKSFAQEPVIRNGYEFHYQWTGQGHYQITATPVKFSEGSRSFFTDETCVIRASAENRPANAQDPPLE